MGEALTISSDVGTYDAGALLDWTDKEPQQAPDAILSMLLSGQGNSAVSPYPDLGFTFKKPWFLLTIKNKSTQKNWLIETGLPTNDKVSLYVFNSKFNLVDHQESGISLPLSERPFKHHKIIFPVTLPQNTTYLLFQSESSDRLAMPVVVYDYPSFYFSDTITSLWNGILFGIVGVLCLYNLLLFASTRDLSYFYYVLYMGGFGLYIFGLVGLASRWLWPESPNWSTVSLTTIAFFVLGFSYLFARSFLQLKRYSPSINTWLYRGWWLMVACGLLTPFFPEAGGIISSIFAIIWPLFVIYLGFKIWSRGYIPAFYFLLSFFCIGIAVVVYSAMTLGLLSSSWLLDHSLQLGIILESIFLSFALAHRMNIIKRENQALQLDTQQRLEAKVSERTQELEQAMEARGQFLAVMSHEIRTPLNGILGTLDLLRDKNLDTKQRQQIHTMESSGNSLLRLIDDILDYSRIDAGKLTIETEGFDLKQLVHECMQLLQQQASLQGNMVLLEYDSSLPTQVKGDVNRIRQVLINLMSNAIKFTENGTITIIVKPKPGSDHIFFLIKDTGIGIAKEKQSSLFELFTQADSSTSRRYGGTGLGLAICRRLVLLMGGNIGVESEPKQGSIFWFHLPLVNADDWVAPPPQAEVVSPNNFSGRLLIVDDNYVNLMVAEGICRQLGFDVQTCESGADAITLLLQDQQGFDAILMDCEMPGMDGLETTREIIRLQKDGHVPSFPIAALTAHAVPEKIKACHDAGMVVHIAKPIRLEGIKKGLAQMLFKQPIANAD